MRRKTNAVVGGCRGAGRGRHHRRGCPSRGRWPTASTRDDLYQGEDFELLDADRSSVVTTPDGVDLAVREAGPQDAPLTVVFAHGFCLRMGAFYFQRARLEQQWGPQVRMVFYDQRGHGQSAEASAGHLHRRATRQGSRNTCSP